MTRRARLAAGIGIAVLVVAQLIPLDRSNPPERDMPPVTPEVEKILRRSCFDCHSHETRWPWYAFVAPMSWGVAHHVDEGRLELNFSDWEYYDSFDRIDRLEQIREEIEKERMPPWFYLPLHPDARLNEEDREKIRAWAGESIERIEQLEL